jgi:hypothetical protein
MIFLKKLIKPKFYLQISYGYSKKRNQLTHHYHYEYRQHTYNHRHRLSNNLHHQHQAISYCFLVASCVSLLIVPLLLTPINN